MKLEQKAEAYIREHEEEALELLKSIARIPAPSCFEEKRAAFVKQWLEDQGARGVFIDEALNVVYPLGDTGKNRLDVFMAHTDVVFPDTEELPVRLEEGRIFAPGIGDDTANLNALLLAAQYITREKLSPRDGRGLLLVANAGEEGLGNLKGARRICADYGDRIDNFVSFDGTYEKITSRAVGSRRYRIRVYTEGGHSYQDFGNRNAIAYLASMIDTLYALKVPEGGRTTYNVGTISGGTSVNTIAQKAEMLYEFRSDSGEDLRYMEDHLEAVCAAYRAKGITLERELAGERPCSAPVDPARHEALLARGREAIKEYTGIEASLTASSTDSNIPLSLGIPSMTLGCYYGRGAHTYEEWVDIASLKAGYRIAFALLLDALSR
ncbi:MAG: M20/M25/M40 family metallo-hydrolase [Treponema sp.]|jgi:acetylornithine deacetylase/succinyl-diaminopimelate desuccinylase-like protein|nr:M20/M25/M40 family metallo-hydrolase [Treponema sp.]